MASPPSFAVFSPGTTSRKACADEHVGQPARRRPRSGTRLRIDDEGVAPPVPATERSVMAARDSHTWGLTRRSEGRLAMRRAARLLAVLTVLLAAVTAASAGPATAEAPPGYFVDKTKLPFAALPGIDTDRYWGV